MTAFFLDSSAAAKMYVDETGSTWMAELVQRDAAHQFYVTRITPVEIASAIFRRVRSKSLALGEAEDAMESLRDDVIDVFTVVDVTPELSEVALDVAEKFALRGYDCVQLAASQLTQRYRVAAGRTPLTFVSADIELNAAARAEGFDVENPNDHL